MANTTVATADYGTVVIAKGSAKIAACILNGTKLNITHAAVGDGGGQYYKPTTQQENLLNECWRGEIASYEINKSNPNMLDITFIVPAEVGGFTVREAAVIDEDGDVIAICNTPDAQKVVITDGVSFPLKMVMHFIVTDASVIKVTVNSSLNTVSQQELDDALRKFAEKIGSEINTKIKIPIENWVSITERTDKDGNYLFTADVEIIGCLEEHSPNVILDVPSSEIAAEAGVCQTAETLDGIVRFWAMEIPTADLFGDIHLKSPNLLKFEITDADIATDEEVKDAVDDVFGDETNSGDKEIASDEEISDMLNGIFG